MEYSDYSVEYEFSDEDDESGDDQKPAAVEMVDSADEEMVVKSDTEIAAWKGCHADDDKLRCYLSHELNDDNPVRFIEPFLETFVAVSKVKDHPEEMSKLHGEKHRWVLVVAKHPPEKTRAPGLKKRVSIVDKSSELDNSVNGKARHVVDVSKSREEASDDLSGRGEETAEPKSSSAGAPSSQAGEANTAESELTTAAAAAAAGSAEAGSVAGKSSGGVSDNGGNVAGGEAHSWPANAKHVLQLCLDKKDAFGNKQWKPWTSIRRSTLKNGGLGIFAERGFDKNTPIGYCIGPTVWRSDIVGGSKPSDAFVDAVVPEQTATDLTHLDNECRMRLVRPERLPLSLDGDPVSLHMGLQCLNNACDTHTVDAKPSRRNATRQNKTLIIEDGVVKATTRIHTDEEIFTGHVEGESNESKPRRSKSKTKSMTKEKRQRIAAAAARNEKKPPPKSAAANKRKPTKKKAVGSVKIVARTHTKMSC